MKVGRIDWTTVIWFIRVWRMKRFGYRLLRLEFKFWLMKAEKDVLVWKQACRVVFWKGNFECKFLLLPKTKLTSWIFLIVSTLCSSNICHLSRVRLLSHFPMLPSTCLSRIYLRFWLWFWVQQLLQAHRFAWDWSKIRVGSGCFVKRSMWKDHDVAPTSMETGRTFSNLVGISYRNTVGSNNGIEDYLDRWTWASSLTGSRRGNGN